MIPKSFYFLLALFLLPVACGGKSKDEMMSQGQKLVSENNYKGAIVVFKNILEKYPDDAPATLALTDAYLNTGKLSQAEAEIEALLKKAPGNPQVVVMTSKVKVANRKFGEALAQLQPLLDQKDGAAEAWELTGVALHMKGELDEAMKAYQKAIGLSDKLTKARLGMAEGYVQLQQLDKAQKQLDELFRLDPKDKSALYLQATLHSMTNDDDALLTDYTTLARLNPNDLRARYALAFTRLTKRNDLAYAEQTGKDLTETFKNAPEGYKLTGLVLLAKGQTSQGLESLLQASRLRPDLDTNIFLAQAYTSLGNLDTAASHLQSVLTANPDMDAARRMLAAIYLRQNRVNEAIAETQKIFERSPSDEAGQRIMAEALIAKKDFDKGLEIISKIAEKEGQPPQIFMKKGILLAMKGDMKGAEADLRKAVEMSQGSLEAKLYLASFLTSANRIDEAVEVLGKDLGEQGGGQALNAMAKLRMSQKRTSDAVELLQRAKTQDPGVLATYYNLAALAVLEGKMDKAAAEYEAALMQNPDDLRSLIGAATSNEALNNLQQAQAFLIRAAKSGVMQAYMALAEFYVRRGDQAAALATLDECVAKNPSAIAAWVAKSRLHAAAGAQEKALSALDRVETVNQVAGLTEKAKYYLARKDQAKAIEMASRLRDLNPRSAEYAFPLSDVQEIIGDGEGARETLTRALNQDSGNHKAMVALAKLEAKSGRTADALSMMDKAMRSGLDQATGCTWKGVILQMGNDIDRAALEYEKALRLQDRQALALNNLAMIYADRKDKGEQAMELALRAYALQGDNAAVLDTLGYALLKTGRLKEAERALELAIKLEPQNAEIAKHLELARAGSQPQTPSK